MAFRPQGMALARAHPHTVLVESKSVVQELRGWAGRVAHSCVSLGNLAENDPPSSPLGLGSAAPLLFLPLTFCSLPGLEIADFSLGIIFPTVFSAWTGKQRKCPKCCFPQVMPEWFPDPQGGAASRLPNS